VDTLAFLVLWKAMIMYIALGAIAIGVVHRVRAHSIPHIATRSREQGSRPQVGPILEAGPVAGWYIRAVDWPDADF
jgi:hypothetical protein